MLKPSIPSDENERIAALGELGILDTPPEERFDRYTRLIKRVLDVPIALVSLVDENRQWFKSCQGLDVSETPRDVSFCGHAILKSDPFVVADALADERFADNPLVTGGPGVRFYAGVPLTAPGGQRIGTLCAIDRKPRALSPDDLAVLTDVASMVDSELAALMLATTDPLTQISNRRGFESIGSQALAMVRRQSWCAVLLYFDLDGFKEINDRHGHAEGDRALQEFAGLLRSCFRECDVIARMGGDEFCVLLSGHQAPHVDRALGRFETALSRHNAESDTGYDLEYSVGAISFDTACHPTVSDLVADADRKMYERKTARRKRRDDPPRQGAA